MLNIKEVERIKNKYPSGTRIKLYHMSDDNGLPMDSLGSVDFVDDEGQIHMLWDNGRTLALIESEDSFEIIEKPINVESNIKI